MERPPTRVYVGTYTTTLPHVQGRGDGIYVFTLDEGTGALVLTDEASGIVNPSFLALHPSQGYLYAVNETKDSTGMSGGGVSAFAVDPDTGALTLLNQRPSHGGDPCHLAVDRSGLFVVVVNHENGSVASYRIGEDGSLESASDIVQHVGSSIDPRGQLGPHAHSVNFDPTNRFALVCDKGIDKVMVYRLDRSSGKLAPNDPPFGRSRPGSAPRHLAFHPTLPYAFVINEIASTITTFAFDDISGSLTEVDTVSTLPVGYAGRNYTADVRVHPNGKFVYGSNRGHDSIAIFGVDDVTGELSALGHESTRGAVPRNFNLDPTGKLLLAANQNSNTIVAFRVDPNNGSLTPTGAVTEVPTPVCIVFAPPVPLPAF